MKLGLFALLLCVAISSAALSDFEEFNLQCTLNVTHGFTNKSDLSDDFELLNGTLDVLLKNDLSKCYKHRDHFKQFTCKLDIGLKLVEALEEFQQSAMNNNTELATKMHHQIEDNCLRNRLQFVFDEDVAVQPFGIIRKAFVTLKCVIRAITEAVKDTNIFRVWILVREELQMILDKTRSCRSEVTIIDQIKCAYIELSKATKILMDFYDIVFQINREVYIRVLNYVKFCLI